MANYERICEEALEFSKNLKERFEIEIIEPYSWESLEKEEDIIDSVKKYLRTNISMRFHLEDHICDKPIYEQLIYKRQMEKVFPYYQTKISKDRLLSNLKCKSDPYFFRKVYTICKTDMFSSLIFNDYYIFRI